MGTRWPCLALLTPALGCFTAEHEATLLLRDAHHVSVAVDTPSGTRTLVPEGTTALEVEIPRTMPPYPADQLKQVFVLRDEVGTLMLRCDTCEGASGKMLVPATGVVRYPNESGLFGFDANVVRWSVVQRSWRSTGRSGHWDDIVPVRLITPIGNVVSLHERKVLPRGLGVLELATGILISGLGALALGLAADRLEPGPTQSAVMTMGGLGGALGLVLTSSGLYHLFAAETDRVLYAAP